MCGYPQFSFWISITLVKICLSCIFSKPRKNTFELVGTVLNFYKFPPPPTPSHTYRFPNVDRMSSVLFKSVQIRNLILSTVSKLGSGQTLSIFIRGCRGTSICFQPSNRHLFLRFFTPECGILSRIHQTCLCVLCTYCEMKSDLTA